MERGVKSKQLINCLAGLSFYYFVEYEYDDGLSVGWMHQVKYEVKMNASCQVREKLELLAEDCIFIRVEKISDNGDVTATCWSAYQDPVVEEVTALEKIC